VQLPDFDGNDEPTRLPGFWPGGAYDPAEVRRRPRRAPRRLKRTVRARSRGTRAIPSLPPVRECRERTVCMTSARSCVAGTPARRRSSWALRHGRPPGPLS